MKDEDGVIEVDNCHHKRPFLCELRPHTDTEINGESRIVLEVNMGNHDSCSILFMIYI